MTLIRTISNGLSAPRGIFLKNNGDLFVNYNTPPTQVDKWTVNATIGVPAMYTSNVCYSIFIDIADYVYCSTESPHQVAKKSLNSVINTLIIVAGNGTAGSGANMINGPRGMFVDTNLNLYLADCWNSRIQFFQSDQLNGTTVPINGFNGIFTLNTPTDVTLDGDGYLFIVDHYNHRILGSGPEGFRCVAGCTGTNGSAANQFLLPHTLSFDSFGNLFIIDIGNIRVQKFNLIANECGECPLFKEGNSIFRMFYL